MPQTSPMNWMLISISFFLLCNMMLIIMKSSANNSFKKIKKLTNKNILWKW